MNNYPIFYKILGNTLIATVTNNFVWFALTFWAIIETRSVVVASFIAGIFAITNMFGAIFFGSIVDHNYKKRAMTISSIATLLAFTLGLLVYSIAPEGSLSDARSVWLWGLVIILMMGTVAGNLRTIALSTIVTLLFTTDKDKANGLVGAVQGLSFSITSVLSGLTIGFYGMEVALWVAVIATAVALIHLFTITIPEPEIIHTKEKPKKMDVRGTIAIILAVPGLMALIFFNTINNFLGGVFMALMDAYGLALVSVQTWGFMWGVMSFAIIAGSTYVAKRGIGSKPLRTIMVVNIISWTSCLIFPLQPSIILLAFGMLVWLTLMPIAEAAEQTVIQKIVPFERQGRVFGFAQSVESAASPITTFMIGPIAQFMFIPFMTTGAGVALIGDWFGVGADRGIALVFMCAGAIGLVVSLIALYSPAYKKLSAHYTSVEKTTTK
ncbi:MAG: MFS transporter [Patescibacteria group bacterium]